ncbi:MAG: 50S ribosomal protein L25 [Myxococcota bacterium]|nr:50S ribosomal protein L25 [Myxococcota bacterium]MDW8362578.1 50S ribosomal protein L25 [Myxococcales bacterium]
MDVIAIRAEARRESGKGPARRLRARGLVPAVLYGPGLPRPVELAVRPREILRALHGPRGRNTILEIGFDGGTHLALLRDVQSDAIDGSLLHVDLYRVEADRPVDARVPVRTTGRSPGVAEGGVLKVVFRELPVRATPGALPVEIVVDVSSLGIGGQICVADLPLPAGVTVRLPAERTVVACTAPRTATEEAPSGAATQGAAAEKAPGKGEKAAAQSAEKPAAAGKAEKAGGGKSDKKK